MQWLEAPEMFDSPDGETLDWLELIQTAKFLGVAPWELAEKPITWLKMGMLAREVENHAAALYRRREAMRRR